MDRRAFNPLYTLRWDDETGEHTISGTSRHIHSRTRPVHERGETGLVWDIAVLDEDGMDVTGRFFDRLDRENVSQAGVPAAGLCRQDV